MSRIAVVGMSGAGKTTVAAQLSQRLSIPHLELDGVYHQADWTPLDRETFRARVRDFVTQASWVTDGNYDAFVGDLIWERAEVVVWLDLPRHVHLRRVLFRTLRRWWRRETLWNGNRERLGQFVDRDPQENLFLWVWTQHATKRRHLAQMIVERAGPKTHRLRTPAEVNRFLANL